MTLHRALQRLAPIAMAILCIGAFLALFHVARSGTEVPGTHLVRTAVAQGSTHFAIADFDGDQQPDLAMIRVTRDGSPNAEYSLELRLSSGKREPIGLAGPAGGLEISPEDVNGDKFADLVITSQMDTEFVAILLNDGKGNFTQAERSSFPDVGRRANSHLSVPSPGFTHETPLAPSRGQADSDAEAALRLPPRQNPSLLASVRTQTTYAAFILLGAGRAPPRV